MIHLLSIIHYPVFGGPHNRNMRLAPVLAQRGVKTTVLLPDEPGNAADRLSKAGINIVQLPLGRLRATLDLRTHLKAIRGFRNEVREIARLIDRLRIDVVQLNGLVNPHAALAAHSVGVPVVWQLLDTYAPLVARMAMAPLINRYADAVMSTGLRVAAVHPCLRTGGDFLVPFYPPVDVQLFKRDAGQRRKARASFGIGETDLVIGTVGNINRQKGHDAFMRAATLVRRTVPQARFVILGAQHANHRHYIERLWTLADSLDLKLGRDLIALDPGAGVNELAQAFDLFWMTPRPKSEGIPTAMEEAMALEMPVVSFDVGSISELVDHGRSGYLVRRQSPEDIARVTCDHLLDADRREELGKEGRRIVEERASLGACAERHIRAYRLAEQSYGKRQTFRSSVP